ncbi:hypothetical protein C4544_07475 [candidate division WS5 bacterium]|uniref:ATP-binding protein n=1 Tax=candidate division WS5 bacterium TaxID=2093353 RepID=A0A419D9Y0_9BACT|nr:MAG: hypothetical protein C4544_07475 [candidate division WS5 bacterium]
MAETAKIIGQDKLLEKEVYPRLKKSIPFIVTGQRGIGKSEIIRWSYDHYLSDRLHFSASLSYSEILKLIADTQGIEDYKKMKNTDLEREIIKSKKIALFIDDIERATPKLIHFLTALNDTWTVYMSGNEPFREELKRVTWGKPKIKLEPIDSKDRLRLADYCISKTGSMTPGHEIASRSRGVPARAWAIAKGEIVRNEGERVSGEEINIAPVFLVVVAGIMLMRFVGKGMGEQDLYLLGGMGMAAGLFIRYFISKAERSK